MILHIRSVFANLCDSLNYIRMVSTHTMDYIDTVTSGILSPHILLALELQKMLHRYQAPYHIHYTYLSPQMIPCIFTDIYAHMF